MVSISRRNFLRGIVYGSAAIGTSRGFYEIDKFETTFHKLSSEKISKSMRIVHITDTHFHHDDLNKAKELSEIINNLNPDLIALTGDYLKIESESHIEDEIEVFNTFINKLHCSNIYACTGNWDEGYEKELFKKNQAIGLLNEFTEIEIKKNRISLAGLIFGKEVDLEIEKKFNPEKFNLSLIHSPDAIQNYTGKNIDLILAGHTHGGHIRIPGIGPLFLPMESGTKYSDGLYRISNANLYVSRGLGESVVPIRINCKPEIPVIDIIKS